MSDVYKGLTGGGIFGAMIYIDGSETGKYKEEDIARAVEEGREHYRRRVGRRATGPFVAYASPKTLERYGNPTRLALMNIYPDSFWPLAHVWVTEISNGYQPIHDEGVPSDNGL